jgi:hypothetical protein
MTIRAGFYMKNRLNKTFSQNGSFLPTEAKSFLPGMVEKSVQSPVSSERSVDFS